MALPGQQMFLNVFNDDTGTGYVVSTTDIGEVTDETSAKVKALWSAFSEYLLDDPTPQTDDVMQNWSK
ncbi:hypothetical protein SAMN05444004_11246 [Jannaschia faecimaris]|uniref:Uncharacterized protein n=1 Tax=Jannaschia faecimaris TaxID=1244108 RepID=A0A1H3SJC6_9RHOB|nr:hypothetical protein [Jannaschia faecimaris]SDZ37788.1 hypothetical protein SAMN05444004_11246 [Jannaschia faecimaris]